ncbi:MAG TPA: hypothetical protein VFF98_04095, partial [Novosphingobium sp.]|nr:hypothetical protein [Novosphingobium sp.]
RLDAPEGLDPADFATLRLALLMRMGEAEAARALAQDVDPDNATPAFAQAALEAYVATEDFTGFCPLLEAVGVEAGGKDPRWQVMQGMCDVFAGNGSEGFARLDDPATAGNLAPGDMLLAQKYAGAAGAGRRSITMDWGKTTDMTPWRYGLALATGLTVPATLMKDAGPRYDYVTASAPMVGLGLRADAADASAGAGILSAAAMVDLYSQIYANDDVTGPPADRALLLRDAYVADTPAARIKAMQGLWEGAADPRGRYARQVLTAYAAARLPASADNADAAGDLIASMLAAGLDANAQRWAGAVEKGSLGWGLIALAAPGGGQVASADIDSFHNADKSANARKSAFLVAGLAGLGRIDDATRNNWTHQLNAGLDTRSHWIELIDGAAAVHNQALVALLAGLGMQGDSWAQMSPRYLYHIVGALSRVGLAAEARMIAAEAVARG